MNTNTAEKRLEQATQDLGFKRVKHIVSKWRKNRFCSDLTANSLEEVYTSFSARKQMAFTYCKNIFKDLEKQGFDVYDFRISSANTSFFSVQFNADIGYKKYVFEITKAHNYYCCLDD